MDKYDNNNKRKIVHRPKQPPPYKPTEATPLNVVSFTFRPLQAKFL